MVEVIENQNLNEKNIEYWCLHLYLHVNCSKGFFKSWKKQSQYKFLPNDFQISYSSGLNVFSPYFSICFNSTYSLSYLLPPWLLCFLLSPSPYSKCGYDPVFFYFCLLFLFQIMKVDTISKHIKPISISISTAISIYNVSVFSLSFYVIFIFPVGNPNVVCLLI